ncbi:MAG: Ureidoglycolate lyase, partial [Anaerospora sp.]|nr:Ureidoglycolate lyase [Anaerospora sp.]
MRFITYEYAGQSALGLLAASGQHIIPLEAGERRYLGDVKLPSTMLALIEQGDSALERVQAIAVKSANDPDTSLLLQLNQVRLLAPIPRPLKNIFCIGKNYAEHAMEFDQTANPDVAIPKYPVIFTKAPTTVIGPGAGIKSHSQITQALDYEVELAVIIGKRGSYIKPEEAMDYIFGYTILNDITARDLQKHHLQWFRGKSLDTSAPMGPYIAHKCLIPDPGNLTVSLKVNGETRQHASTADFIFTIPTLISTIS